MYFTADDAVDASERGEAVVLVRNETSPEDVHGMQVAEGILTARGGLVSHAAVVARGWGIPAVVGADAVKIADHHFTAGSVTVAEGDVISLDGTTGEVVLGAMALADAEPPAEFRTILALGGPRPEGEARGAGQRRHRCRRRGGPAASAPRASASAARSTCSSPRTGSRSCEP